jgi:hypothetical protein
VWGIEGDGGFGDVGDADGKLGLTSNGLGVVHLGLSGLRWLWRGVRPERESGLLGKDAGSGDDGGEGEDVREMAIGHGQHSTSLGADLCARKEGATKSAEGWELRWPQGCMGKCL